MKKKINRALKKSKLCLLVRIHWIEVFVQKGLYWPDKNKASSDHVPYQTTKSIKKIKITINSSSKSLTGQIGETTWFSGTHCLANSTTRTPSKYQSRPANDWFAWQTNHSSSPQQKSYWLICAAFYVYSNFPAPKSYLETHSALVPYPIFVHHINKTASY